MHRLKKKAVKETAIYCYSMRLLLLTFYFLISEVASAQKDTSYIIQFQRPYNIQFNTWVNSYNFFLSPPPTGKPIEISPNLSWQAGISLGLRKVTLTIGFQVPGTSSDIKTFGRTNYYDFSFGYYQSRSGGEIYSRSFDGANINTQSGTKLLIRPDAHIEAHGLNLFYNFNHKRFSYRSAISLAEFQRRSSGAVMLMCNMGYRSIATDSSLIPAYLDTRENFADLNGMRYLRLWHITLRPGYAYNLCFKKGEWFFAPSVYFGLGMSNYHLINKIETHDGGSFEADAHGKLSFGHNHSIYFWNFYITYEGSLNNFPDEKSISAFSTSFGFNFGYRFSNLIRTVKWL